MPPTEMQTQYWRYIAEQIFFHVLLRGGEGNPFLQIRHGWFVDLAAPKLQEMMERRDFAMHPTDQSPTPVLNKEGDSE